MEIVAEPSHTPLQLASVFVLVETSAVGSEMVTNAVPVQPSESVMSMLYEPALSPVAVAVV